ncbi:hypothetical protein M2145_001476 [Lachnospiraceae bacterium PF1-21]|uniref:DUF6037 family protein n=1 Tax=Ohessyouella blattaphilus TaxID=2949333 RepID=UPI003E31D1EF
MFEKRNLLKEDMRAKDVLVESFHFYYQEKWYIVLVQLPEESEEVPGHAIAKLVFLQEDDFAEKFLLHINDGGIMMDATAWQGYFGIEGSRRIEQEMALFSQVLSELIPSVVNERKTIAQREALGYLQEKNRVLG